MIAGLFTDIMQEFLEKNPAGISGNSILTVILHLFSHIYYSYFIIICRLVLFHLILLLHHQTYYELPFQLALLLPLQQLLLMQ